MTSNEPSQLKKQFLLDPNVIFLNHGSFGATPKPVFDAYQRWQRELETQPVEFLGRRHNSLMQKSREALGKYFNTRPDSLVYTTNVTASINIVARSLKLGPNDEVLASDHEYGACDRTWRFLARENGFRYLNQPVSLPLTTTEAFIENFWRSVSSRTKVIFISHITSPTAIIFPVAEICKRAREQGILTLVDGAHVPGQIPLDLEAVGADFYGGNLHKWLCAPKGAGFLYARPEAQPLVKPLIVSWGYESENPSGSIFVDHHEWTGTRDIAAFLTIPVAIQFQSDHDWDTVRLEAHELLRYAQREICRLSGLPALHPDAENWFAQMGAAPLPSEVDLVELKTLLYEEFRVEVPLIAWNGYKLIRVSVQGYNDQNDIDILLSALRSNL